VTVEYQLSATSRGVATSEGGGTTDLAALVEGLGGRADPHAAAGYAEALRLGMNEALASESFKCARCLPSVPPLLCSQGTRPPC
jgi:hypothetical protein